MAFLDNLNDFAWESQDQKKGYLSFVKWARDRGLPCQVTPIDLYFIQKDLDSDVYWRDLVGDQVRRLEDEIRRLQEENVRIKARMDDHSRLLAALYDRLG